MDSTATLPNWKSAFDKGFRIFPCHWVRDDVSCSCGDNYCPSAGKHPLAKGWQDDATTDLEKIEKWWQVNPAANVGVPTGNGIVVIDIDPRNDGITSWEFFTERCGHTVSAIGKSAGIVVDERTKGKETVRKFASAHDLRRAFAVRWATKLKPTQLRELMRHASITTTLAYYVGEDAEATADALWSMVGNTPGNAGDEKKNDVNAKRSKRSAK